MLCNHTLRMRRDGWMKAAVISACVCLSAYAHLFLYFPVLVLPPPSEPGRGVCIGARFSLSLFGFYTSHLDRPMDDVQSLGILIY